MIKSYFLILVLAHVIGDFYVQIDLISQKKESKFAWLILHGLCYWIVVLVISVPILTIHVFIYGSVFAALHLFIDLIKFLLIKNSKETITEEAKCYYFYADQLFHLISLFVVVYSFVISGKSLTLRPCFSHFFSMVGLSATKTLSWIVILLIICKPTNIAISRILYIYKPLKAEINSGQEKDIGKFVGIIERVIIIMLVALNQYSAIGLVLTAKSIARYDKISKNPTFSEYYLIGTLLSTLAAIAVSFIVS